MLVSTALAACSGQHQVQRIERRKACSAVGRSEQDRRDESDCAKRLGWINFDNSTGITQANTKQQNDKTVMALERSKTASGRFLRPLVLWGALSSDRAM